MKICLWLCIFPLHFGVLVCCTTWEKNRKWCANSFYPEESNFESLWINNISMCIQQESAGLNLLGICFAQCISTKKQKNKILKTNMVYGTNTKWVGSSLRYSVFYSDFRCRIGIYLPWLATTVADIQRSHFADKLVSGRVM